MFKSKNHLLLHVSEIADKGDLQKFAEVIERNPLNDCKVKTKGDEESIIESLKAVSKAILEHSYGVVFEDTEFESEDDDEIDYYDSSCDEDEEE